MRRREDCGKSFVRVRLDREHLSEQFVRSRPLAAILLPVTFFLSVPSPGATEPNGLAYVGAIVLILELLTLGVGLWRASRQDLPQ